MCIVTSSTIESCESPSAKMATTAGTTTTTGTTSAADADSTQPSSCPSTLQSRPRPYTLRRARLSDLSPAARTVSLGFWDDVLFGRLIHPFRNSYPSHVDKYWYRKFIVDYWDWSHVMLVTTEPAEGDSPAGGKAEIVTGFAHWSRIAPSRHVNYKASWELTWWDPSEWCLDFIHYICCSQPSDPSTH